MLIFAAPKMMLMAEGGGCKSGEKQLERRLRPFAEWVAVPFSRLGEAIGFYDIYEKIISENDKAS